MIKKLINRSKLEIKINRMLLKKNEATAKLPSKDRELPPLSRSNQRPHKTNTAPPSTDPET